MGDFTSNLRNRVSIKGPKEGYCVICGSYGKLSKDHVPPKKCNNLKDHELKPFGATRPQKKGTTSQGGTHFRTLCSKCNSEKLGLEYDPELVNLSNDITSTVLSVKEKNLILPEHIVSFVKPQRLARSVIGHLLAAASVNETKENLISYPMPDALRKYFLDSTLPLPPELHIYYWVYPSRKQVVIKGAGKMTMYSTKDLVLGHIIKFLPLAFWVIWEKPKSFKPSLYQLVPQRDMRIDDLNQMRINLKEIPALDFPEAPNDNELIMMDTKTTSVALPKN